MKGPEEASPALAVHPALTVDAHGSIVLCNRALADRFGRPQSECVDKSLRLLIEQVPHARTRTRR
jgi:PAS domain-containing protein